MFQPNQDLVEKGEIMRNLNKIEQTVGELMNIVDTLMDIIRTEVSNRPKLSTYDRNTDLELLYECHEVMQNLKINWQENF